MSRPPKEHRTTEPATREDLRALFGEGYAEGASALQARWGATDAWRQVDERTAGMTRGQWAEAREEGQRITDDFATALRFGVPPWEPDALAIAERHRRLLERFHDCPPPLHRSLADLYVTDRRVAEAYDDLQTGLPEFVRDAVHANADRLERERHGMARSGQVA